MKYLLALGLLVANIFCSQLAFAGTQLDQIAALVNDDIVTEQELQQESALIKKQLQINNMPTPSDSELRQQVLQQLIDIRLQLQMAEKVGVDVSDLELNDALKNMAKRNKESLSQFRKKVEALGMDYNLYRENLRRQMIIGKLQSEIVRDKVKISDADVKKFLKQQQTQNDNTQYHVQDILVPVSDKPNTDEIATARDKANAIYQQLQQGGDFNKEAIEKSAGLTALQGGDLGWRQVAALPDVFAKNVKTLKLGEISKPIHTANGFHIIKLIAKKDEKPSTEITETRFRQIMVMVDNVTDDTAAKNKLLNIRKRASNGEKFSALAKQYSQDPKSALKGGDMGWQHDAIMPAAIAQAVAKLPKNAISQPFKVGSAWVLIEVTGKRTVDGDKILAADQARQTLYSKQFNTEVQSWIRTLRGESFIKVMPA